jgi:hypothetical protein
MDSNFNTVVPVIKIYQSVFGKAAFVLGLCICLYASMNVNIQLVLNEIMLIYSYHGLFIELSQIKNLRTFEAISQMKLLCKRTLIVVNDFNEFHSYTPD